MNLFEMASRGVDRDALPDHEASRARFDFGPAASPAPHGAMPTGMNDLFNAAAGEYGVDPAILKGIAYAESRFRPDIISGKVSSPAGAVGLMQFMPDTAKEMGINPLDPVESVFGAAAYLRQSLDRFGGDTERAIASYNWGRNREAFARDDWYKGLPAQTRNYVGTVLEFADRQAVPAPVKPQEIKAPLPNEVAPARAPVTTPGPDRNEFAPVDELKRGLQTGVTGLKQLWESNLVLKDATAAAKIVKRLEDFDRVDAGDREISRSIGYQYENASPENRKKIRATYQHELGKRQEFVEASLETMRKYQHDMLKTKGRVTDLTDVQGVKDFSNWLSFNAGSGIASMAPLMLAAVATGPAAPVVVGALGLGMATGEINNDRIEHAQKQGRGAQGVGEYVASRAASTMATAVPFAGLEMVAGPVGSVLKAGAAKVKKEVQRMGLKQAGKEVLKDTGGEVLSGGSQEAMKIAAAYGLGEADELFTKENAKKVVNSAAAEGAGGLAGGAGRVAVHHMIAPPTPAQPLAAEPAPQVWNQPTTPQAPVVPVQPAADRAASEAADTSRLANDAGTLQRPLDTLKEKARQRAPDDLAAAGPAGAQEIPGADLSAPDARPTTDGGLGSAAGVVADVAGQQGADALPVPSGSAEPAPTITPVARAEAEAGFTPQHAGAADAQQAPATAPHPQAAGAQSGSGLDLPADASTSAPALTMGLTDEGTLSVDGDPRALVAFLNTAGVDRVFLFGRSLLVAPEQAAQAQRALAALSPEAANALKRQPPPVLMKMREGDMLDVEGDTQAVRQWLEDAGIPPGAMIDGDGKVVVTAGSVERAKQALGGLRPSPTSTEQMPDASSAKPGASAMPLQDGRSGAGDPLAIEAGRPVAGPLKIKGDPAKIVDLLRKGGVTNVKVQRRGVTVWPNEVALAQEILAANQLSGDRASIETDATNNGIQQSDGAVDDFSSLRFSDLGPKLGEGGAKQVFAYGEKYAVGILHSGRVSDLENELKLLEKIKEMGLPVVNAKGPIMVGDRPALVYDRFEAGTKDAVRMVRGQPTIVGELDILNGNSISDLKFIRKKIMDARLHIDDLQFLVGNDGGLVISDPLGVKIGPGYKKNVQMIDVLIKLANTEKKK